MMMISEELKVQEKVGNKKMPLKIRDIKEREALLKSIQILIKREELSIAEALKQDLGKSIFESYLTETGIVLSEISLFLSNLKSWSKTREVPTPITNFYGKSRIYAEPYGTALILGPWNYPLQNLLCPAIAALAAGNPVALRPSVSAPATYKWFEEVFAKNLASPYITVVPMNTSHEEVLSGHYQFIFYTGGIKVGRIIAARAAELMVPCVLELGGKSPTIVDKQVNIDKAAKRIVWGKCINLGQVCIAPDYVLVHRSVKEALIERMIHYIKLWYGDGKNKSDRLGHIINDFHFNRLISLLDPQKVVFGGQTIRESKYIHPTLMSDVDLSDACMQEEIFGPILPIIEYDGLEEAVGIIESNPDPLAFYIFSSSRKNTKFLIQNVAAGGICVNDTIMHFANHHFGFGGIGSSGMGKYHGKAGFDTFTHYKPALFKNTLIDVPLRYQPVNNKLGLAKLFFK